MADKTQPRAGSEPTLDLRFTQSGARFNMQYFPPGTVKTIWQHVTDFVEQVSVKPLRIIPDKRGRATVYINNVDVGRVESLNNTEYQGKDVSVILESMGEANKLVVRNISKFATEADCMKEFPSATEVTVMNRRQAQFKLRQGSAFVKFSTSDEANKCVEEKHGKPSFLCNVTESANSGPAPPTGEDSDVIVLDDSADDTEAAKADDESNIEDDVVNCEEDTGSSEDKSSAGDKGSAGDEGTVKGTESGSAGDQSADKGTEKDDNKQSEEKEAETEKGNKTVVHKDKLVQLYVNYFNQKGEVRPAILALFAKVQVKPVIVKPALSDKLHIAYGCVKVKPEDVDKVLTLNGTPLEFKNSPCVRLMKVARTVEGKGVPTDKRTLLLKGIDPSTAIADITGVFPTSVEVKLGVLKDGDDNDEDKSCRNAFVLFANEFELDKCLKEKQEVTIRDKTVTIGEKGEEDKYYVEEERQRMKSKERRIVLKDIDPSTTTDDIKAEFPTSIQIKFGVVKTKDDDENIKNAFVIFANGNEKHQCLKKKQGEEVTICGKTVKISDKGEELKYHVEGERIESPAKHFQKKKEHNKKIMLMVSHFAEGSFQDIRQAVTQLFETVQIAPISFDFAKKYNTAGMVNVWQSDVARALTLSGTEFRNKMMKVTIRESEKSSFDKRTILVKDVEPGTSEDDLRAEFPGCVYVHTAFVTEQKKGETKTHGFGFVRFPSPIECDRCLVEKWKKPPEIKGKPVVIGKKGEDDFVIRHWRIEGVEPEEDLIDDRTVTLKCIDIEATWEEISKVLPDFIKCLPAKRKKDDNTKLFGQFTVKNFVDEGQVAEMNFPNEFEVEKWLKERQTTPLIVRDKEVKIFHKGIEVVATPAVTDAGDNGQGTVADNKEDGKGDGDKEASKEGEKKADRRSGRQKRKAGGDCTVDGKKAKLDNEEYVTLYLSRFDSGKCTVEKTTDEIHEFLFQVDVIPIKVEVGKDTTRYGHATMTREESERALTLHRTTFKNLVMTVGHLKGEETAEQKVEREKRTLLVRNLDGATQEEELWKEFPNATKIDMPTKTRKKRQARLFAFIEFSTETEADSCFLEKQAARPTIRGKQVTVIFSDNKATDHLYELKDPTSQLPAPTTSKAPAKGFKLVLRSSEKKPEPKDAGSADDDMDTEDSKQDVSAEIVDDIDTENEHSQNEAEPEITAETYLDSKIKIDLPEKDDSEPENNETDTEKDVSEKEKSDKENVSTENDTGNKNGVVKTDPDKGETDIQNDISVKIENDTIVNETENKESDGVNENMKTDLISEKDVKKEKDTNDSAQNDTETPSEVTVKQEPTEEQSDQEKDNAATEMDTSDKKSETQKEGEKVNEKVNEKEGEQTDDKSEKTTNEKSESGSKGEDGKDEEKDDRPASKPEEWHRDLLLLPDIAKLRIENFALPPAVIQITDFSLSVLEHPTLLPWLKKADNTLMSTGEEQKILILKYTSSNVAREALTELKFLEKSGHLKCSVYKDSALLKYNLLWVKELIESEQNANNLELSVLPLHNILVVLTLSADAGEQDMLDQYPEAVLSRIFFSENDPRSRIGVLVFPTMTQMVTNMRKNDITVKGVKVKSCSYLKAMEIKLQMQPLDFSQYYDEIEEKIWGGVSMKTVKTKSVLRQDARKDLFITVYSLLNAKHKLAHAQAGAFLDKLLTKYKEEIESDAKVRCANTFNTQTMKILISQAIKEFTGLPYFMDAKFLMHLKSEPVLLKMMEKRHLLAERKELTEKALASKASAVGKDVDISAILKNIPRRCCLCCTQWRTQSLAPKKKNHPNRMFCDRCPGNVDIPQEKALATGNKKSEKTTPPASSAPVTAFNWVCPNTKCNNLNYSHRDQCVMCKSHRPPGCAPEQPKVTTSTVTTPPAAAAATAKGAVGKHKDEWKCPRVYCGNRNFYFRDKCNKCKCPRPPKITAAISTVTVQSNASSVVTSPSTAISTTPALSAVAKTDHKPLKSILKAPKPVVGKSISVLGQKSSVAAATSSTSTVPVVGSYSTSTVSPYGTMQSTISVVSHQTVTHHGYPPGMPPSVGAMPPGAVPMGAQYPPQGALSYQGAAPPTHLPPPGYGAVPTGPPPTGYNVPPPGVGMNVPPPGYPTGVVPNVPPPTVTSQPPPSTSQLHSATTTQALKDKEEKIQKASDAVNTLIGFSKIISKAEDDQGRREGHRRSRSPDSKKRRYAKLAKFLELWGEAFDRDSEDGDEPEMHGPPLKRIKLDDGQSYRRNADECPVETSDEDFDTPKTSLRVECIPLPPEKGDTVRTSKDVHTNKMLHNDPRRNSQVQELSNSVNTNNAHIRDVHSSNVRVERSPNSNNAQVEKSDNSMDSSNTCDEESHCPVNAQCSNIPQGLPGSFCNIGTFQSSSMHTVSTYQGFVNPFGNPPVGSPFYPSSNPSTLPPLPNTNSNVPNVDTPDHFNNIVSSILNDPPFNTGQTPTNTSLIQGLTNHELAVGFLSKYLEQLQSRVLTRVQDTLSTFDSKARDIVMNQPNKSKSENIIGACISQADQAKLSPTKTCTSQSDKPSISCSGDNYNKFIKQTDKACSSPTTKKRERKKRKRIQKKIALLVKYETMNGLENADVNNNESPDCVAASAESDACKTSTRTTKESEKSFDNLEPEIIDSAKETDPCPKNKATMNSNGNKTPKYVTCPVKHCNIIKITDMYNHWYFYHLPVHYIYSCPFRGCDFETRTINKKLVNKHLANRHKYYIKDKATAAKFRENEGDILDVIKNEEYIDPKGVKYDYKCKFPKYPVLSKKIDGVAYFSRH